MKTRIALAALAGLTAACATVPTGGSMAGDCSRACLTAMLDAYLNAVVAHDPAQAPLFDAFRQTENAVVIPIGQGTWRSVSGMGPLDRRYYDPLTGNAVFMGTLVHDDDPAIVSVRIAVAGDEITEAEWFIAHAGDPGIEGEPGGTLFDIDDIEANPPPQRVVPPAERASREVLAAVSNSYFDGITSASRDIALTNPSCTRRENGFLVTGRPLAAGREWDGTDGRSDCKSGQGAFDVANVAARRIPVIDVEQQIVITSVVFIRTHEHPKWRNSFSDVMVMDGGLITDIYATMRYIDPERAVPNWPPYDGNFAR
jgi:hypothetical protein